MRRYKIVAYSECCLLAALKQRDFEWWQSITLVDNVAPEPEAVKKWLLTLSAHEQEGALEAQRERVRGELANMSPHSTSGFDGGIVWGLKRALEVMG